MQMSLSNIGAAGFAAACIARCWRRCASSAAEHDIRVQQLALLVNAQRSADFQQFAHATSADRRQWPRRCTCLNLIKRKFRTLPERVWQPVGEGPCLALLSSAAHELAGPVWPWKHGDVEVPAEPAGNGRTRWFREPGWSQGRPRFAPGGGRGGEQPGAADRPHFGLCLWCVPAQKGLLAWYAARSRSYAQAPGG